MAFKSHDSVDSRCDTADMSSSPADAAPSPQTSAPAISLRGLTKTFGPVTAVDGIDLDVALVQRTRRVLEVPGQKRRVHVLDVGIKSVRQPVHCDFGETGPRRRDTARPRCCADTPVTVGRPDPTCERAAGTLRPAVTKGSRAFRTVGISWCCSI